MIEFDYVIKDEHGIHARPAGELVKLTKQFESVVQIKKEGKTADAGKILALMGLGIKKDDKITVMVSGNDEKQAAVAIEEFLNSNL